MDYFLGQAKSSLFVNRYPPYLDVSKSRCDFADKLTPVINLTSYYGTSFRQSRPGSGSVRERLVIAVLARMVPVACKDLLFRLVRRSNARWKSNAD